jgi:hypothetical protein
MHKGVLLFLFLGINLLALAQNNVLLLQKRGKTQQTFFSGSYIALETKLDGYADGIIAKIANDSVYIRHFDIQKSYTEYGGIYFDTAYRYTTVIHYNDIGAIVPQIKSNIKRSGTLFFVAGAGVLALGVINGLYRGEPAGEWIEPSGYITAGALIGLGFLMRSAKNKKYRIGKKYTIKILQFNKR